MKNRDYRSGGRSPQRREPTLPNGYLKGGYYNESGHLKQEVILNWPEELADSLSKTSLKMTQLRKFYNQCKAIEQKLRFSGDFEGVKSDLYCLQRDAQYSFNRKVVPQIFLDFIERNVELATSSNKDFKGFIQHYESLVAYAAGTLGEG